VTDNSWWFYPPASPSTVGYTSNAANQYTAVGAVTPAYNANGNLTSDGTFSFGYDAESRLTSAVAGGNINSYAYDAQGRRKTRTLTGTATVIVTDADNRPVLEYAGSSGALLRWYAYGLGSNDVLSQVTLGGSRATMVPDIQGSVLATLDSGTGAFTKQNYLPYGKSASTSIAGTFGFTAQRIDAESGLYYYRARMYHTAWGRFLQPDPLGMITDDLQPGPGGTGNRANLYAYVGNDPLNNVDPLGLFTFQIGVAGGSSFLGFLVPQGGFGLAIDTRGNVGSYAYTGAGVGVGVSAGAGLSLQFSNASTIYDLQGQFYNSSFTVGAGYGGSVDSFTGTGLDNRPIIGAGATIGVAAGASGSVTQTTTQICGAQGCAGSANIFNNTPFITPAQGGTQWWSSK
jgi:RHS repeat-associated protein